MISQELVKTFQRALSNETIVAGLAKTVTLLECEGSHFAATLTEAGGIAGAFAWQLILIR